VLVFGVGLGWIVRNARIQRKAVVAIEKAGGRVGYNWEWQNDHWNLSGKPWAPRWLVNTLGADYFGHVVVVLISTRKPSAEELAHVGNLRQLEVLLFYDSNLADNDLAHLNKLANLRNLQLSWSGSRRGLKISDSGIERLKGLTNLEELGLAGTQISDAGLRNVEGMTKLKGLSLEETPITDNGLAHLKDLTELNYLDVSGTQVTDKGLVHLKGLTKVKLSYVRRTSVTDAGVKELQRSLPNIKMYR
jgi:hypothetical protein